MRCLNNPFCHQLWFDFIPDVYNESCELSPSTCPILETLKDSQRLENEWTRGHCRIVVGIKYSAVECWRKALSQRQAWPDKSCVAVSGLLLMFRGGSTSLIFSTRPVFSAYFYLTWFLPLYSRTMCLWMWILRPELAPFIIVGILFVFVELLQKRMEAGIWTMMLRRLSSNTFNFPRNKAALLPPQWYGDCQPRLAALGAEHAEIVGLGWRCHVRVMVCDVFSDIRQQAELVGGHGTPWA